MRCRVETLHKTPFVAKSVTLSVEWLFSTINLLVYDIKYLNKVFSKSL